MSSEAATPAASAHAFESCLDQTPFRLLLFDARQHCLTALNQGNAAGRNFRELFPDKHDNSKNLGAMLQAALETGRSCAMEFACQTGGPWQCREVLSEVVVSSILFYLCSSAWKPSRT